MIWQNISTSVGPLQRECTYIRLHAILHFDVERTWYRILTHTHLCTVASQRQSNLQTHQEVV